MVNAGMIIAVVFVCFIVGFVLLVRGYTSKIDWSKEKKIKDPLSKLKGGVR